MAYSDFMPKEEKLHFWTWNDYFRYLERYIEKFDLGTDIQLNTEVEKVVKKDKKWQVHTKSGDTKKELLFDHVVVSRGSFQKPYIPDIPGIDKFKGSVYRSREYKNSELFISCKVLCVGMGETSVDLTTEIADLAEKCTVAVRHPYGSKTIDMYTIRASNTMSHYADEKYHSKIYNNFFNLENPGHTFNGKIVSGSRHGIGSGDHQKRPPFCCYGRWEIANQCFRD